MHILVVDDNRDILDLIYRLLVADGYEVTTASDGRAALQQEAETHPDLIILDVNLPFVNGWDICRRIKAKRAVPILLLTVRAEQIDIEHSQDAGADGHIAKPFDIADFLAHIDRVATHYYGRNRPLGRISINHR